MDPTLASNSPGGVLRASTRAYGQAAHARKGSSISPDDGLNTPTNSTIANSPAHSNGTANGDALDGSSYVDQGTSDADPASGHRNTSSISDTRSAVPASTPSTHSSASPSHTKRHERPEIAGTNDTPSRSSGQSGSSPRKVQKRTAIGPWDFVKSIGAGSMGQVKLAINRYTRQPAAVKIVAKAAVQAATSGQQSTESNEAKDARVIREAAVGKLVHHPNISQLYEIYSMSSHYYLVFEYIAGGQLLDYIITHGSVKEVQARRIAREIASALDYCHRHSIVHRDLKIENILITEKGSVKIIDFGLANLFRRDSLLKTFCGSLYFAAPELLNAMPYVGPEVDIWSFGVVLYVLVCGKVPFEDKSMSALHAKIKRGVVEYPTWLSPLCTDLLSRMLVVSPSERATMREILHHPWMNKGYDEPPSPHIANRRPLEQPVDNIVIQEMASMQFGYEEALRKELESVLLSQPYAEAVSRWHANHNSSSSDSVATTSYRELPFRVADPLNSFHPLISMYILTQERLERMGSMPLSSQLASERDARGRAAITDGQDLAVPRSRTPSRTRAGTSGVPGSEPGPGRRVVTVPSSVQPVPISESPIEVTRPAPARTKHLSVVPDTAALAAPEAPAPARAARSRAKTYGHMDKQVRPQLELSTYQNEVAEHDPSAHSHNSSYGGHAFDYDTPSGTPERQRSSNFGSLFRRLSLRRGKTRSDAGQEPVQSLSRAGSSANDRNKWNNGITGPVALGISANSGELPDFNYPPKSPIALDSGNNSRVLSRNSSLKRPVSPQVANTSPGTQEVSFEDQSHEAFTVTPPTTADSSSSDRKDGGSSFTRRFGGLHHRAKSTGYSYGSTSEHEPSGSQSIDAEMPSIEAPKPVFFKGFFSVQSTSTRPLVQIRQEIIRVLGDIGIEYVEIKGGFSCIHGASPHSTRPANAAGGGLVSAGPLTPLSRHRRGRSSLSTPLGALSPGRSSNDYSSSNESVEIGGSDMLGHTPSHMPTPVRFEISIVRVPLLTLHGVQFKKISGNVWEYKSLAQEILEHLHL